MKLLRPTIVFFLFCASLLSVSCSGDIEPLGQGVTVPTEPEGGNGSFEVDIDGAHYIASVTQAYIQGGSIQIAATRAQGDAFGFLISGTGVGNYPANTNLVAYTPAGSEYDFWAVSPDDPNANTGAVTVTSIDTVNHTISGTFAFTGYWSDNTDPAPPAPKHFTNGIFTNLPYTTASPTGDSFMAKVNGNDFSQNDLLATEIEMGGVSFISVGAANAGGDSMTVSVKSALGTGTYTVTGNAGTDPVQIMYANNTGEGLASAGSVTVSEKTATRIKGTFNGTVVIGTAAYQITAGSFDVAY